MQVQCPDCDTRFEGAPQTEVTCPACMSSFLTPKAAEARPLALLPEDAPMAVETAAGSSLLSEMAARVWEVQTTEGGIIHGLSRYAVREGIYTGKLGNSTKVRRADGTWEALGAVQEFAAVFRLIGVEAVAAPASRKIAGWKGERVEEERPSRPAPKNQPVKPPVSSSPPLPLLLGGGGLLLLLLLGALYLAFG